MAYVAYAAETAFVPLAGTQGGPLGELYNNTPGSFSDFINSLFRFAIIIGAIAAVLRIAYAGYLYMGQSDMWSKKGEAKAILGDVTFGLLLLLSIWIILNQINPDILSLKALDVIGENSVTSPTSQAHPGVDGDSGVAPPASFDAQGVDQNSSVDKWCTQTPGGERCYSGADGKVVCDTLAAQMSTYADSAYGTCVFRAAQLTCSQNDTYDGGGLCKRTNGSFYIAPSSGFSCPDGYPRFNSSIGDCENESGDAASLIAR